MQTTTNGRLASANATPKKQPRKRASKPRSRKQADSMHQWAIVGIALLVALSCVLNGYAFSLHAPTAWAGWSMGIVIPVIVLILSRVSGFQYRRKNYRFAATGATIVSGILALSVYHCAISIAAVTGSSVWLSVPMAVAIDAGFVFLEACTLTD